MKAMVTSLRQDWRELLGMRGQRARTALYLLAAGVLGLVLMMLNQLVAPEPGPAGGTGEDRQTGDAAGAAGEPGQLAGHEAALAAGLAEILAQVEGAGRVRVQVQLAQGPSYEYERDSRVNERTTQEEDAQGGVRVIQERSEELQTVFGGTGGTGGEPVIRTVTGTEVRGVLVVAEGAADPRVLDRLSRAVEILLDVPLHRVYVVPGDGGG